MEVLLEDTVLKILAMLGLIAQMVARVIEEGLSSDGGKIKTKIKDN